jgi:cytochrome c oxidase subunit IV
VVVFFMHVKYSPRLITLVVVGSFVWLGIMLFITLSDYWSRGWLGAPGT